MNPIATNTNFAAEIKAAKTAGLMPKGLPENKKAWETAQGLEANFFNTMLSSMFEGLSGEGPMGSGGTGMDAWRSMQLDNYGQSIAKKGGIGLAPAIYREMLRHQESASHAFKKPGA